MSDFPDYSARDRAIRHLTYTPLTRRKGVPQDLFSEYWRDVHGPVCARLPGLGYYVRHHFDRTRSANLWPRPDGVEPPGAILDGMVEIGFSSEEDQTKFTDASPLLFADEKNFLGHDVAYALPNGSRTLVDHDPDPIPNREETGRHHLHLHVHGRENAPLGDWLGAFAETLAKEDGIEKLRLHLPEPYDNAQPAPAAPRVDHELMPRRQEVGIVEICWTHRLTAEPYLASDRYAAQKGAFSENVSAMSANLVSGVYTFIRDGILTTAGLRGSRPAALIETLGAQNQIEASVAELFDGRPCS